ncbi:hypothetical protein E2C01_043771 [Portunus trituberculatus]|uniref:Uncharacterized protein n=1 Tax=Portunus trituberculatus TaxID=210409 RepID=A0A5B7FWK4_PORTR|nr:hypothetical protein [Portunus trituberculatus]
MFNLPSSPKAEVALAESPRTEKAAATTSRVTIQWVVLEPRPRDPRKLHIFFSPLCRPLAVRASLTGDNLPQLHLMTC